MNGALASTEKGSLPRSTVRQPHPLDIQKVEVKDSEYSSEVPEHMKNKDFPGFPSCSVFVGMPGSGKSNLLMYMLLSPNFWFGFFDEIYLFGPTVKSDKLYDRIEVPDDHIISDPDQMLPKLTEILQKQQASVESSKKDANKVLVVFEDITSFFHKIQSKTEFQRWYVQFRHLKGSVVSMVHKYKAFNRTARMCSRHLLVWECNMTERKQLYEDFGPPQLSLKQWLDMMQEALTPTPDQPKPFFYINTTQPVTTRFRRCFTEVFVLPESHGAVAEDQVKAEGKSAKRKEKRKKDKHKQDRYKPY